MAARAATSLLALVLTAAAGVAAAQDAGPRAPLPPPGAHAPRPPRTIAVAGSGRVAVAPDAATFTVGVESTARGVAAATAETNAKMKAVLDAVTAAGVPAKDVRTSGYDVTPERPWKDGKQQPVTGYRVSTTAEVKVRDLARLGKVLDAVTAAGSNQLHSLRMERADPRPQEREALALAYADARAKAAAIAIAAGAELGDFLSVSEQGIAPRPVPGLMMARAAPMGDAAPAPVAQGELEFGARVEVVFAVK